jgi:hypothetical protein
LGCYTVLSGRSLPAFQRCLLPPSSGRRRLHSATSQMTVIFIYYRNYLSLCGVSRNAAQLKQGLSPRYTFTFFFIDSRAAEDHLLKCDGSSLKMLLN